MKFLCDNLYKNFENHNRFDNRNRKKVDNLKKNKKLKKFIFWESLLTSLLVFFYYVKIKIIYLSNSGC